jgi:hypothetical protein
MKTPDTELSVHKMTPGTASRKATATTTNLPTKKGVSFAKADVTNTRRSSFSENSSHKVDGDAQRAEARG